MAQGLFGGATNYETQSAQDILFDIENWINLTNKTKEFALAQYSELNNNDYWNKIPYNFRRILGSSIFYLKTIEFDLTLIKNAIINDNVTEREIFLLKSVGYKAKKYNIDYGRTFHEELHTWCDYDNPNFKTTEELYSNVRDYFVTLQDAVNATIRLEEYMKKGNVTNNTINIGDNAKGIQIQQGTINSTQISNENSINYDQTLDALHKIDELLENNKLKTNCNDNSNEIRKIVSETIAMVEKRESPIKIKNALNMIKKLSVGIAENIIANQIIVWITSLFSNF